jgi:hypothetical protein
VSIEIVGPFQHRELHIDGWCVPFVNVIEVDGGRVHFTMDRRLGFNVSAADFEQAARLLATGMALALGMPCWPDGDFASDEERERFMGHVPFMLRPRRVVAIEGVSTEGDE